ncbi:hypothetical protein CLU79DRAFT_856257 [Phycomyces nitens]|nr:hypothetical protein CLU79DRAFT_856257 [Phycomyces nitens]
MLHFGKCVEQIGIIDIKRAQSINEFSKLMNSWKLDCDIVLETPLTIIQSEYDSHYQTMLSLMSYKKQIRVNDNSESETTFNIITDHRIVQNGFSVRWHKDWRDLLENIRQHPTATFGEVRPKKAIEYLAKKAYLTSDDPPVPLEPLLRGLAWQDSVGKYKITPTYSHTIAYTLSGPMRPSSP